MPRYYNEDTNNLSIGFNSIPRRRMGMLNLDVMQRAIDKIDANHEKALAQRNAISATLSQLEMNAAEDEWKTNYIRDIQKQIDDATSYGSYSTALDTATKLAGNVITDPAILGRVRANQEYNKFVDSVLKADIDEDTRQWALETNPYSYDDIRDNNGNIVGGTEWKPTRRPVNNFDLSRLSSDIISRLAPNSSSYESFKFVNNDGSYSDTFTDNAAGLISSTSGTITYLDKDRIKNAVAAAIEMNPDAKAYIEQKYDVDAWKGGKGKKDGNLYYKPDGSTRSRSEYLDAIINPWAEEAKYSQSTKKTTYHDGFQTAMALRQQNQAANLLNNPNYNILSTEGTPISYNVLDDYNKDMANFKDAVERVETFMPRIVKSKAWREAKVNNDYQGLIDAISNMKTRLSNASKTEFYNVVNTFSLLSNEAKEGVIDAVRNIRNYGSGLRKFKDTATSYDMASIEFISAYNEGTGLPAYNAITKSINKELNKFNNNKHANEYSLEFSDNDDVNAVLSAIGINVQNASANGINTKKLNNGNTELVISANNPNLVKAIIAATNQRTGLGKFAGLFGGGSTIKLTSFDDNGNKISSSKLGNLSVSNIQMRGIMGTVVTPKVFGVDSTIGGKLSNIISSAQRKDEDARYSSSNVVATTNQGTIIEDPYVVERKKIGGNNLSSDLAEHRRVLKDMILLHDYTQKPMYAVQDKNMPMTIVKPKDVNDYARRLKSFVNKDDFVANFYTDGYLSGLYVELPPLRNTKGEIVMDGTTIFVPNLITDEATDAFKRDTRTTARQTFNSLMFGGKVYQNRAGFVISDVDNKGNAKINGIPVDRDTAEKQIEYDKLIEDFGSQLRSQVLSNKITNNEAYLLGRQYAAVIDNQVNNNISDSTYKYLMDFYRYGR